MWEGDVLAHGHPSYFAMMVAQWLPEEEEGVVEGQGEGVHALLDSLEAASDDLGGVAEHRNVLDVDPESDAVWEAMAEAEADGGTKEWRGHAAAGLGDDDDEQEYTEEPETEQDGGDDEGDEAVLLVDELDQLLEDRETFVLGEEGDVWRGEGGVPFPWSACFHR